MRPALELRPSPSCGGRRTFGDVAALRGECLVVHRFDGKYAAGNVVPVGVTKFSGVTAFDIAALDSVKRAAPFGKAPREIVSPDGNMYLHWEFHRNAEACSTFNARPFILKVHPKAASVEITPPAPPSDPAEAAPPERREHNLFEHRGAFAQN